MHCLSDFVNHPARAVGAMRCPRLLASESRFDIRWVDGPSKGWDGASVAVLSCVKGLVCDGVVWVFAGNRCGRPASAAIQVLACKATGS
jgi:hypothetical protein